MTGMSDRSLQSPDLWSVIAPACSALSIGVLAGALGSLREINPDLVFRVDFLGIMLGGAGAATGWFVARGLWRLSHGLGDAADARLRQRVVMGLVSLGLAVLVGFGMATVNLPDSRRRDMIAGGLLAVLVIGVVGGLIHLLARVFGRPDEPDVH